ncbi:hypothetical protein TeGR_g7844, partial [Tetraparma gracilis]
MDGIMEDGYYTGSSGCDYHEGEFFSWCWISMECLSAEGGLEDYRWKYCDPAVDNVEADGASEDVTYWYDAYKSYEEHIGNSPYTYTVAEGPTDSARSSLDFESRIKANEEFRVVIETNDFHGNPTSHANDVFKCTLDNDDAVEVARADDDLEATLTITFSLDGVQIGEPVEIIVAPLPPPDFTNTYIAAGVGGFVLLLGYAAYKRYANKAIVREDEPTVEIGEKLKEMLNSRISSQNLFIAIELADSASDVVKGVQELIEGRPEKTLEIVQWVLFILLAAYSGPLGIYAMIERGKVKKGFQDMMSGTDAKIVVYARALDEATPSVDEDSVKVYANPPP